MAARDQHFQRRVAGCGFPQTCVSLSPDSSAAVPADRGRSDCSLKYRTPSTLSPPVVFLLTLLSRNFFGLYPD